MIIVPATVGMVQHVAANMRQRDRDEFMPLGHFENHAQLVASLFNRFGDHPDVFAVFADGRPETLVAIAGLLLHRPNVATLLFFATTDFPLVGLEFTRFVKRRLFPTYIERGVHRIECISLAGYDEVHRWLGVLGLKEEAKLKQFGRGGEDYVQFVMLADVRPPRAH